jgi:hypothetical protein
MLISHFFFVVRHWQQQKKSEKWLANLVVEENKNKKIVILIEMVVYDKTTILKIHIENDKRSILLSLFRIYVGKILCGSQTYPVQV